MDPNANLRSQRDATAEIMKIWDECPEDGHYTATQLDRLSHLAMRLAELAEALDGWIKRGGFLPDSWQKGQKKS